MFKSWSFLSILAAALCASLAGCSAPYTFVPAGHSAPLFARASGASGRIPANGRRLVFSYVVKGRNLTYLFLDADPAGGYERLLCITLGHHAGRAINVPAWRGPFDPAKVALYVSPGWGRARPSCRRVNTLYLSSPSRMRAGTLLFRFPNGRFSAVRVDARNLGRFIAANRYLMSHTTRQLAYAGDYRSGYLEVLGHAFTARPAGRASRSGSAARPNLIRTLSQCRLLRQNPMFMHWCRACRFAVAPATPVDRKAFLQVGVDAGGRPSK